MIYQGIVSDIDGTFVVPDPLAKPSKRNLEAAYAALEIGKLVSLATGRPWEMVEGLLSTSKISGSVVVDNGAAVIDIRTKKTLYEALISWEEVKGLIALSEQIKWRRVSASDRVYEDFTKVNKTTRIRKFSLHDIIEEKAFQLVSEIENRYKDLAVIKASSYKGPGYLDVYITNALATKAHAVYELAKLSEVSNLQLIGIGDSYNDYPLLSACGLKVAMGNAVSELKGIADWIAPNVENDGFAVCVEKFLLDKV